MTVCECVVQVFMHALYVLHALIVLPVSDKVCPCLFSCMRLLVYRLYACRSGAVDFFGPFFLGD